MVLGNGVEFAGVDPCRRILGSEWSGVGGGVILGMETSSAERDSSVICHNPRGSGAPLRPRL